MSLLLVQEQDLRVSEARQRLEIEQAAAAAASAATSGNGSLASGLARPDSTAPSILSLEPSEGALSLSAPVTMNDKQHRTAAALLSSLGQTAARGRDRLGRLERVLNTIAADAAEPSKVCRVLEGSGRRGACCLPWGCHRRLAFLV
jgi:hypothetical protein